MIRLTALLLTVVTGFTGLVYEVAWQKYLASLLGSHGEATAAVLAIFLGVDTKHFFQFVRVGIGLFDDTHQNCPLIGKKFAQDRYCLVADIFDLSGFKLADHRVGFFLDHFVET